MENNTNFSNRESGNHNFHAKPFVVVNCALNAPFMLVSTLGNTLVLAAIVRTPSIRSPSMIMLASLATTDFLVGLIAQPLFIADELIMKNHVLNALSSMIGFALCGISLAAITAISIDRFIALQYHLRYATLVTNSRVICCIVAASLIILICSGLRLWDNVGFHLLFAMLTGVCLVISTLCYIKIYQIVQRHRVQIRSQEQATKSHRRNSESHRKNAIKAKRFEHVRFLYLYDCMLLSLVYFALPFWNFLFHMENGMDHLDYRCVYELVPESSSVLLAYSPTSDCSCEDGKRYVMHHHWLNSKTVTFVRQFWLLSAAISCILIS